MKHIELVGLSLFLGGVASAATVAVGPSTEGWTGFMNVSETPSNGGAFVFGSGWGVNASATSNPNDIGDFDDGAETLTLRPSTIDAGDDFWFSAPGGVVDTSMGNKFMEANLFQSFAEGSTELASLVADGTLIFEGTVLSNTLPGPDYTAEIFIKEFTPGFATVTETAIPLVPGAFSLSVPITGAGGEVQYGFRTEGTVIWTADLTPAFGTAVISTAAIPEPSVAFLGTVVLGMFGLRRRR